MSEQKHECTGCGKGCSGSGQINPETLKNTPLRQVKTLVGVMSGKGGVGKSLITILLARELTKTGKKVAILDADALNPSIPRLLGLESRAVAGDEGLYPAVAPCGLKVMSLRLLMEREADPVLWPGPIQAKAVGQFWNEVVWDDVDVMLIDLPTGTGDVAQKLLNDFPLDGLIVVSTPQGLSKIAAMRAIYMVQTFDGTVLGLVENFSVGDRDHPLAEDADLQGIPVLDRLPLDSRLAQAAELGQFETLEQDYLKNTAARIAELAPKLQ